MTYLTRRAFNRSALHIAALAATTTGSSLLMAGCANNNQLVGNELLINQIISDKRHMIYSIDTLAMSPGLPHAQLTACSVMRNNHQDHINALLKLSPKSDSAPNAAPSESALATSFEQVVMTSTNAAALRTQQVAQTTNSELIRMLILIGAAESVHGEFAKLMDSDETGDPSV